MQKKHRRWRGRIMESGLIALCLAIFGVIYWLAVG
jgi:hypothetical protein